MAEASASVVQQLRAAGCVFAEDEAALLVAQARSGAELDSLVARRCAGEPLEHVLGWAAFAGQRVQVGPGVFVPRRRSELLAARAVSEVAAREVADGRRCVVVDLCCGSGALALAVLVAHPEVRLHAADIEPRAVACARANLASRGGMVHLGDLYHPLPLELLGQVDVLVVNAPYVPSDEVRLLPPESRLHEPLVAVDGGADGVDLHRRVAEQAPQWLAPGGVLLIETSQGQAPLTVGAMRAAGLSAMLVRDEDLEATVALGRA